MMSVVWPLGTIRVVCPLGTSNVAVPLGTMSMTFGSKMNISERHAVQGIPRTFTRVAFAAMVRACVVWSAD